MNGLQAFAELAERSRPAKAFDPIKRYCPHEPTAKQRELLADTTSKEILYGGQAGGGKSDAVLMRALKYIHVPGYAALIVRRTFQQLNKADALIPRSHEWFTGKAHWNGEMKRWTFRCPSGGTATIEFGHIENEKDKYNYQGAAFQTILPDELTQFLETQYRYLMSRLRKLERMSAIPTQMVSTSNPGGEGHDWVLDRLVSDETRVKGARFLPASLDDNPHLDREDYLRSLEGLDETTKAQLRDGLWIRDTQGLVYRYNAAKNRVQRLSDGVRWRFVLGIDYGTNATALVEWAFSETTPLLFCTRAYKEPGMDPEDAAQLVKAWEEQLKASHGRGYERMVGDVGGLGKGYAEYARRRWYLPIEPAEKTNKTGYQKLLNSDLERSLIQIVEPECGPYIDELSRLRKAEGKELEADASDNHCCDAGLYSWRWCRHYLGSDPGPPPSPEEQRSRQLERLKEEALAKARKRSAMKFGGKK